MCLAITRLTKRGRRFILVSSTEATKDEPIKNVCRDVTAQRVYRLNESVATGYDDLLAKFAYLRTKQIAFEDIDYDLRPADAWTALEAIHGLPLTLYEETRPWNSHEGEAVSLVLVDRFDLSLLDWVRARAHRNLFVYAWAPGQITQHLDGVDIEVLSVRDALIKRFQQ